MFYKTGLCLLLEGISVWSYTELPPAASYLPPIKAVALARQWWLTPLIPALWRQRAGSLLRVGGQPDLQIEFQDNQGYAGKSCFKNNKGRKD